MDITCPDFEPIEPTSDYGSRETSGAEAEPIMGFCLTDFGRTGNWVPLQKLFLNYLCLDGKYSQIVYAGEFLFFQDGDALGNNNFI